MLQLHNGAQSLPSVVPDQDCVSASTHRPDKTKQIISPGITQAAHFLERPLRKKVTEPKLQ